MSNWDNMHIGRSFSDTRLEDLCPCPKEACGLVNTDNISPDCDQHPPERAKTLRQVHKGDECPSNIRLSIVDAKDIPIADINLNPHDFAILEQGAKDASQTLEEFVVDLIRGYVSDKDNDFNLT